MAESLAREKGNGPGRTIFFSTVMKEMSNCVVNQVEVGEMIGKPVGAVERRHQLFNTILIMRRLRNEL